jgi:Polyketide cyclase / dehydrase and lipid transport
LAKTVAACPTEIVATPIDVVWNLLTHPGEWGSFYDLRVLRVEPLGAAIVGQRVFAEAGPRWLHLGVSFEFVTVDPDSHKLEFNVRMPLGLTVHESLDCVSLDSDCCRVNYQCNFDLPGGWRGILIGGLLRRELTRGPANSIHRLKRAAEAVYRGRGPGITSSTRPCH